MSIKDKFLRYVSFDTQSNPHSDTYPSTEKQKELGAALVKELHDLGIKNAYMDEYSYVYATIDGSPGHKDKAIGLIAHLDTATEMSGANVNARVIENYQGDDLVLNEALNIILSPSVFPALKDCIGHDLVVTDGTTLLGADDKAGIAIIMELVEFIVKNPNFKHPTIRIAFTPDEEIGRGTDKFNVDDFKVDFAYTLDGGKNDTINFENFNAASAEVVINGKSIHPGTAKNKMINSMLVAFEFHQMLPVFKNPAYTEKYEGFNHITEINGSVNQTKMEYIIRNHDSEEFKIQKQEFERIAEYLNDKYGENTIKLTITDSYYNMRDLVIKKPEILKIAEKAIKKIGLEPKFEPIRGGTDGALLSHKGIICPNLGTGGGNFHGAYEYASLTDMNKMVEILKLILTDLISL
ncbi:MAG: peptidase T [Bacilli bacterium]